MEIDKSSGTVNPFAGEQLTITEEIKTELEQMERRRLYLLELLKYYEPTGDTTADL